METYKPGTMIGQYEVASLPMKGGMGVVYFCLDHGNDKKPVALKTFRPELLPNREARDRFLREGTAWVNLGNHPHIVRCHKVEYIDPTAFLVLELIAKEQGMEDASLRSWIGSPIKPPQALLFALQIARSLAYANGKIPGFVHRDLKPENILVGADKLSGAAINRVRVTDFGLAAILNKKDLGASLDDEQEKGTSISRHLNLLSSGHVVGTPEYMAPEQWKQGNVDCRADIYALGCILAEMLSGRILIKSNPRSNCRELHVNGESLRKVDALQNIPKDIRLLLRKCLAADLPQRYSTWQDVVVNLEELYTLHSGQSAPQELYAQQTGYEEKKQTGWAYSTIGLAYHDIGKVDTALTYFEYGLSIAREVQDRQGEACVLGYIGSAYVEIGDLQHGIEYTKKALLSFREVNDVSGTVSQVINLGNIYADLGESPRAIEYYEKCLDITRSIDDRRKEGLVLGNLGLAYSDIGKAEKAISCLEQALKIDREFDDIRGIGKNLGNLGNAYSDIGNKNKAIEYYEQALVVRRNIGDRRGEGNVLGNLGNAYLALGNTQRSLQYYDQQLTISIEIGDRRGMGTVLGNLGVAYSNMGDMQRAIAYHEKALAIRQEIGDSNGVASDSYNMGKIYANQGDVTRALPLVEVALRIWTKNGHPNAQYAKKLLENLQYDDMASEALNPIHIAFRLFAEANTLEDMQSAVKQHGFMASDEFIETMEEFIKEQAPSTDRSSFEKNLRHLKKIAGKQSSNFLGRLFSKK